jgi:hypothetical protein
MFIVTWLFDKLGYMPKVTIDSSWPFPATQKPYTPHEFEFPLKKEVKKTVKVPKATTRKTTAKKTVKKK